MDKPSVYLDTNILSVLHYRGGQVQSGASRVNGPQVVILSGTPPPFGGVERRITSVGVFGAHRLAILRLGLRRTRPVSRLADRNAGVVGVRTWAVIDRVILHQS
ncbi:MAG: hypothetical protein HYY93_11215 [Planctomycetes bacterium]|nr:hypothetical protein [Planctomycetota bacterium]